MKDVNNLDVMMKNLVKNNIAKIKSTTPVNPSIKKDGEKKIFGMSYVRSCRNKQSYLNNKDT